MKQYKNYSEVMEYVESILKGKKVACKETIESCQRFKRDLENPVVTLIFRCQFVIGIIEKTFVPKGEDMQGYR